MFPGALALAHSPDYRPIRYPAEKYCFFPPIEASAHAAGTQSLSNFLRKRSSHAANNDRAGHIEATVSWYHPSWRILILQDRHVGQQIDAVVLDDEELVRTAAVSALQAAGDTTLEVDCGNAAMHKSEENGSEYTCLILDNRMSGTLVLQVIRER